MKRILQVVSCLELGGTEAFIMSNYRSIDRSRIQFDFLVFIEKDYPYASEIQNFGGHIHYCGLPKITRMPAFILRVKNIIDSQGPYDAVHSHVNHSNAWVMLAAWIAKVPLRISHSHCTNAEIPSGLRRIYSLIKDILIKKCSTRLLACSPEAGNDLYGEKYFSQYGTIIPNGIDISHFLSYCDEKISTLRKEFDIPEHSLVIGNISRFDEQKNPLFTIEVFSHLLQLEPKALLIMGGPDGGLLEASKARVRQLGLEDNVRFIGKRTDVRQCLQLINIYLFPSRYEGLGIVLLEAQIAGCLCITSDAVPREVDIGLGSVHFLNLTDSPATWANHIISLNKDWTSPCIETRKRAFAKSGYDIRHSSKKLMEVYHGYEK